MERNTLEQATRMLLENTSPIDDVEEVSLWDAGKRVLAEDITALADAAAISKISAGWLCGQK